MQHYVEKKWLLPKVTFRGKTNPVKRYPAKAGSAKCQIWISDDFDEPLEEFKEYME